jgi:hypothetical protein
VLINVNNMVHPEKAFPTIVGKKDELLNGEISFSLKGAQIIIEQ